MIIDFHSHILPQIDDGSQSVSETVEMLTRMKAQGIETVVATPHFYAKHDYPERFLERRRRGYEKLLSETTKADLPRVLLGAEVAYFRGMSESKVLKDLVIEGTNAVLVELPMGKWNESMYRELKNIHTMQGLVPIVAHVDRYMTPYRSYGIPEKLAELPVLVQANAEFFTEKSTAKKARKLLAKDMIHLLGSDCHNLTDRRPNLGDALEAIETSLGREALARIETWQSKIINCSL